MIRKHINFLIYIAITICVVLCVGCADGLLGEDGTQHHAQRIELSGEIDQVAVTRVNDGGFCNGDGMGIYIVDYKAGIPGTLQQSATVPTMYATLTMKPTVNGILTMMFTGRTFIPI